MTVVKLVYILGNFCKYRTCSSQVLNFLPTETIILSCFCVCVCVCVFFFFFGGGGGFQICLTSDDMQDDASDMQRNG